MPIKLALRTVIKTVLPVILSERIKTQSAAEGAVVTTGAAAVVAGGMGWVDMFAPGSAESYIAMVVVGLVGLYQVVKKEKSA